MFIDGDYFSCITKINVN